MVCKCQSPSLLLSALVHHKMNWSEEAAMAYTSSPVKCGANTKERKHPSWAEVQKSCLLRFDKHTYGYCAPLSRRTEFREQRSSNVIIVLEHSGLMETRRVRGRFCGEWPAPVRQRHGGVGQVGRDSDPSSVRRDACKSLQKQFLPSGAVA